MLASLGLVAFTAVWNPEPTRARALNGPAGGGSRAPLDPPAKIENRAAVAPASRDATASRGVAAAFEGGKSRTASRTSLSAASRPRLSLGQASPTNPEAGQPSAKQQPSQSEFAGAPAISGRSAPPSARREGAQVRRPHAEFEPAVFPERETTARQTAERPSDELDVVSSLALGGSASRPIEAQLVRLQQQVDELAQATTKQQTDSLERTMQMLQQLQQMQQSTMIESLGKQVQKLQAPPSDPATPPATAGARTAGEAAPPLEPPLEASPEAVLKAQPSSGDSEAFSLQIQDAEITQVLDMLGQLSGQNILVGRDVTGKVSANLQEVTIDQALQGILRSLGYAYEHDGDFIYVMTPAEIEQRKLRGRKVVTKVYHPHYISVIDLKDLIIPLQTPAPIGKIAVTAPSEIGIANDKENAGGNRISQNDALLVQDYAEVIEEIDAVVAEMDVPPLQVHIEAMILSVKLEEEMKLGVNFALLHGHNNQLLVSGNGQQLNNASGFPGSGANIVPPMGDFIANTAGLKYGFLRGDVSAFLEAIETITDANVVAAPQLRVLNKQRAQLLIGRRLSYKTLAFQDNQTVESANFLDTGTQLILRPFIAPDGLIRMEVHPEKSSGSINQSTGLPDVETTEVTTNVMVRDGMTVVIGGLITEEAEDESTRVPVLGAIPVIGNVFRNRSTEIRRNEIIVLITPRIVSEPDDALEGEAVLAGSRSRAEHFRAHLSPVNRHNLARMCYERAVAAHERGELYDARNWAGRALHHSKNDINALRLRDQIDLELAGKRDKWLKLPFATDKSSEIQFEEAPPPGSIPDGPLDDAKLPPLPRD